MFRFSLDDVLHYRRELQESREREFAEATRAASAAAALRDDMLGERLKSIHELQALASTGIPPPQFLLYQRFLEDLALRINQQEHRIHELRQVAEEKRQRLIGAMRDVEVMEELERQERRDFEYAERRAEQKELDEFSVSQFGRKDREKISAS